MSEFIPVNQPLLEGNERKYLLECLDTGWISSEGPFVERFEQEFAARVGRRHGIAVSNGSVALDAAVVALGIGPGDEVIMPTFTIISCAAAVARAGAIPVLVDSDAESWNMDVNQLESRISARTKAIMVVHLYGLPVDMAPILALAERHGLAIIEDAAEMHGQTYNGRPCGSFGTLSTFSFYANKHITTGEGGMILTDDPALAGHLRSLRNLSHLPGRRFVHEELGWNFRLTNLQAALGVAQLENLDRSIERKRRMGQTYRQLLEDIEQIELPLARTEHAESVYWVFGLVLADSLPFDAAEMMARLAKRNVGTRPFFWPMHEQPVFIDRGWFKDERYPVAERIARRGFYLPSGMALSREQCGVAAAALRACLLEE